MPLPPAAGHRRLRHQRQFDLQIFARGDGLWEVDALLTDIKTFDVPMAAGVRAAGSPIHEMLLRLVVNEQFQILEAGSETRWMPYQGICDRHGDAYAKLVGLNLMRNFRAEARERVGGVAGCTHITELAQVLPTAVMQAFAGDVVDIRNQAESETKPYQLDRCHALRSDSEAVRLHYPRWYRAGHDANASETAPAPFDSATASDSPDSPRTPP